MRREEVIASLNDEEIVWMDNRGFTNYRTWRGDPVSVQITPAGINFYCRPHMGKWQRYERLLFDKCEIDMNYPVYICNHTKQERSRTLKEILENRG